MELENNITNDQTYLKEAISLKSYLYKSKKQLLVLFFLIITNTGNQLLKFMIYKSLTYNITNINEQHIDDIYSNLWLIFGKVGADFKDSGSNIKYVQSPCLFF